MLSVICFGENLVNSLSPASNFNMSSVSNMTFWKLRSKNQFSSERLKVENI